MKLSNIIYIAITNFWSRRLRAILTVVAVSIGIGAIIFLVSLGYGLEKLVTSQVANFEAFTVIDVPSANLKVQKINDETLSIVKNTAHVTSVATTINVAGRLKTTGTETTTESLVQSCDPEYLKMAGITLKDGHWYEKDKNQIVINTVLKNLLFPSSDAIGKSISADVNLEESLRKTDLQEGSIVKNLPNLTIAGVVDDETSPIAYLPQEVIKASGAINYTSIKVKIDDKNNAEVVRKALENLGYSTEYVGDTVKQIIQIFSYFRILLGAFGLIALIVAALGTFNTLTISLLERIREVGLMKVMGMNSRDIYFLFMAESVFIGFTGGIIGIIFGHALGMVINAILALLAQKAGVDALSVFYTPWTFPVYIGIFSLVVSFITGWYPARRAVKVDALDAIRYE